MSFQERRSISIGQRRDRETKDSSASVPWKKENAFSPKATDRRTFSMESSNETHDGQIKFTRKASRAE
jgi:hypothetical protein